MPTTETVTTTQAVPTTVKQVRKHYAAVRTIQRNLRLRLYVGRNGASTAQTESYHTARAGMLLEGLPKELATALRAEHGLAQRISENRDLGNPRPELRSRLAATRREIKELTR